MHKCVAAKALQDCCASASAVAAHHLKRPVWRLGQHQAAAWSTISRAASQQAGLAPAQQPVQQQPQLDQQYADQQPEQQQQQQLEQPRQLLTCKRCRQRFDSSSNCGASCRCHPAMYSGGEVAKAIGFVRQSSAPEHQLGKVVGRTGLMRFWDCCGAADSDAPGCQAGFHLSFDDTLNEAQGWKE